MVYGNRLKAMGHLAFFLLTLTAATHTIGSTQALFATWEGFEADKCASVWLIRRFIASHAEIRFYPRGAPINEGIPFDTPDARLRRYHNKSTFETLLEHYALKDERLAYIGRIIHDIEVNIWEKKVMPETLQVQSEVQKIIARQENEGIIKECQAYFDQLYQTDLDIKR